MVYLIIGFQAGEDVTEYTQEYHLILEATPDVSKVDELRLISNDKENLN